MTHAQWYARLRRNLALVNRAPEQALRGFDVLLNQVESDCKKAVGEWHLGQTLEALSIVQSQLEDHRRSAETMRRLAQRHEQQVTYFKRAYVAASAMVAIEFAYAGNRAGALDALRDATRMAAGLRPQEKLLGTAQRVVTAMPPRRRASRSR